MQPIENDLYLAILPITTLGTYHKIPYICISDKNDPSWISCAEELEKAESAW